MGVETVITAVVSLAYQWYQSEESKDAAQEQADKQKKQADLQKRIEEAAARRQARIRKAQIAAAAGARGIGGTTIESSLRGIEKSLETGTAILESQTQLQKEQFDLTASNIANEAEAQFLGSLGTFTGQVLGYGAEKISATKTQIAATDNPTTSVIDRLS